MNYYDLQQHVWRTAGLHDSNQKQDWRTQDIKDAINDTLVEVSRLAPYLFCMVRESSIAVVSGTAIYELDDWCRVPLFMWTEDTAAHKVKWKGYRKSTWDGSRNPSASPTSLGPWELVFYPKTTAANRTAGACPVTEGSVNVTGVTGGVAADVGRMLRINGEENDYKIVSQSVTAFVVDRAIRSRLTGIGVTGVGAGYTTKKWEVGPAGVYRVKLIPTPTAAATLYYSGIWNVRRLVNDDDVPEIDSDWHHLLWKGACAHLHQTNENAQAYATVKQEYEQGKAELRELDQADPDNDDTPRIESMMGSSDIDALPNDVYLRD